MSKVTSLAMRDAYGETLIDLGSKNLNIVVLDADLSGSTRTAFFAKSFPDRFFNMGISEQDMIGTAAGLACVGKIPFASSFAIFGCGRPWEQIRNSVCYANLNVKIVCTHAGITVGEDGASHQALEDIAIMRVLPNMQVIVPADYYEAKAVIQWAAKYNGPVYIRLPRGASPTVYSKDLSSYQPSKCTVLQTGTDVAIFACGIMVASALDAAKKLSTENISASVVNVANIKPLAKDQIASIAAKCGAVVTAEEHSVIGGLGSAIAECLATSSPVPMSFVGTNDTFGESGKPAALLEKYGLTAPHIVDAVKSVLQRKSTK